MKIKYLKRTAVSNYPTETKSVLLHSNFIFLSLSILFLLLLALTFDAIYIVDFVHHRHLLNTDLSAFAGVGTGSSERAYIAVGLPLNAVCKKRVWARFFFFFLCLFLFATTEHGSALCLLKQNAGRFKATFCDRQTAQLEDRDSMKMQSHACLEGPFYLLWHCNGVYNGQCNH